MKGVVFISDFSWGPKYILDNDEIDKQHEELFEIINAFLRKCESTITVSDIIIFIDEFWGSEMLHIRSEEELMRKAKYPLVAYHSSIHQNFVNNLEAKKHMLITGELDATASVDIFDFISEWMNEHILDEDSSFFLFCNKTNLVTDKAYLYSICEVYDSRNNLISIGNIDEISEQFVTIQLKGKNTLEIPPNTMLKIHVMNSKLGFQVWTGLVYLFNEYYLELFNVKYVTTQNQRISYRVQCDIPAIIEQCNTELLLSRQAISAKIIDMSIGGIMIESNLSIKPNDRILVEFHLFDVSIKIQCIVMRRISKNYPILYYGCSFLNCRVGQENIITKFIFMRQKELMM